MRSEAGSFPVQLYICFPQDVRVEVHELRERVSAQVCLVLPGACVDVTASRLAHGQRPLVRVGPHRLAVWLRDMCCHELVGFEQEWMRRVDPLLDLALHAARRAVEVEALVESAAVWPLDPFAYLDLAERQVRESVRPGTGAIEARSLVVTLATQECGQLLLSYVVDAFLRAQRGVVVVVVCASQLIRDHRAAAVDLQRPAHSGEGAVVEKGFSLYPVYSRAFPTHDSSELSRAVGSAAWSAGTLGARPCSAPGCSMMRVPLCSANPRLDTRSNHRAPGRHPWFLATLVTARTNGLGPSCRKQRSSFPHTSDGAGRPDESSGAAS